MQVLAVMASECLPFRAFLFWGYGTAFFVNTFKDVMGNGLWQA